MTKTELVHTLAGDLQLTKQQAAAVVDLFVQCILEGLRAGEPVTLRGFGSFRLRHRRARIARNPHTGVPVQVPAKTIPWFTPGHALHGLLNPHLRSRRPPAGAR